MESLENILKTEQLTSKKVSIDTKEDKGEKTCDICLGAGFVHPLKATGKPDYSDVVPCRCRYEEMVENKRRHLLKQCALPKGSGHMTFENFDICPGLEGAYNYALSLAEGDGAEWLTLMSDTNRGKTHLAIAICRRWLERGKPARYIYVPLLLDELRAGYDNEGDESYAAKMNFFLNVPLLVMDDLGVEKINPWASEKLDTIVDYRLMNELSLVVTTNSSIDELQFRIANRLNRKGRIVVIDAEGYNIRKNN